jgi:hypothetical protein
MCLIGTYYDFYLLFIYEFKASNDREDNNNNIGGVALTIAMKFAFFSSNLPSYTVVTDESLKRVFKVSYKYTISFHNFLIFSSLSLLIIN